MGAARNEDLSDPEPPVRTLPRITSRSPQDSFLHEQPVQAVDSSRIARQNPVLSELQGRARKAEPAGQLRPTETLLEQRVNLPPGLASGHQRRVADGEIGHFKNSVQGPFPNLRASATPYLGDDRGGNVRGVCNRAPSNTLFG